MRCGVSISPVLLDFVTRANDDDRFYDKKKVSLSHDHSAKVKFIIEVNPMGHGPWMVYKEISIEQGKTIDHLFEDDFKARWVRINADRDCEATAWFVYE